MTKWIRSFFLILLFLAVPPVCRAEITHDSIGYMYYSPGLLLTPLGTLRFGGKEWEGGLLGGALGFDKVFRTAGASYVAFGPGFNGAVGLYGAAGFEWPIFRWLAARPELGGFGTYNNRSSGNIFFGLAVHI